LTGKGNLTPSFLIW